MFILTLAQWPARLLPLGAVEQGVRHRTAPAYQKYERRLTLGFALSI